MKKTMTVWHPESRGARVTVKRNFLQRLLYPTDFATRGEVFKSYKTKSDADIFVAHIKQHLQPGQKVICKICNKTIDEIVKRHAQMKDYDQIKEMYIANKEAGYTLMENFSLVYTEGFKEAEKQYKQELKDLKLNMQEKRITVATDVCSHEWETMSGLIPFVEKCCLCGEERR